MTSGQNRTVFAMLASWQGAMSQQEGRDYHARWTTISEHFLHDLQEIVSLTFSPDTKLLAAQGGASEWNLVIWSWEKAKQVAMVKVSNPIGSPIHQVFHLAALLLCMGQTACICLIMSTAVMSIDISDHECSWPCF